ncbi:MAG TPA: alpha-mannosidase [Candidatus Acidoferrum sp.]|nr:alpha-mannosidase [Candidatus Acidoferrum sp.]
MKKMLVTCAALMTLPILPAAAQEKVTLPESYKAALNRLDQLTVFPEAEWRYHADVAHPEDPGLNDSDWQPMARGDSWKDGARVLRRWIEIPKSIGGYDVRGARVELDLRFESQDSMIVTVFSNRSQVARTDEDLQQPIPLTESAVPGEKFLVAVRVDANAVNTRLAESRLRIFPRASRPDPGMLRTEILAARLMVEAYEDGRAGRESILDSTVAAIDFAPLEKGDQAAFDQSLARAHTQLEQLKPWLKQFVIRADGNSHIDMAWLWPWTETVEVVRNTFRSALDLMREYPDFKFSVSAAQAYSWMEEKYPELFKEIEERVREGRWEIVGGMWVEPDLNMPGGESLVRQLLTGKTYFRRKFGVNVNIGWNPDSFGYNWQLPQIYKRSGIDYFLTQKLLWADEFTKFPYRLFWWESPDGSRVLTYFPHNYAADTDAEYMARDLAYWSKSIYGNDTSDHPTMLHLYGVGDHGGGPTRTMLDNAARLMKPDVVYPTLQFSTASSFFSELEKKLPSLKVPVWKDELYFEYHRGVLTTQAETKRRIRTTEELLLNAEKFSSIASLFGKAYPADDLDQSWKRLLFDDFHDIFPGSGIAVNYLDAKRNLEDVGRVGDDILRGSLGELTAHIRTTEPGTPVVIFNPLSWSRSEVVEIEAQLSGPVSNVEVADENGKAIPSQLLNQDKDTNRVRLLVLANVPSLGYTTYFVRAAARAVPTSAHVKSTATTLENEYVRLTIDPATGCMTSLFDKKAGTESLATPDTDTGGPKTMICGNLLQAFQDKPKAWDAWNIDADFEKVHWDITTADEVKVIESGPLRAILRVKQHFQNSTFVRDIIVTAGSPRVDVKTSVEWNEKHILLKVGFALSARSEKATFEIPYGSIERPTTRNTPAEKGKFEVPALQWGDISDAKHGLSLLNDCKYGYDAKGNVLRLSLLRSPEWPDPHADEGHHEFTYSIYAHPGSWRDALTVRRAYDLNYPLIYVQAEKHAGSLPAIQSFLNVAQENVVVTAFKKAEDGDSLVVRFYEWAGKNDEVRLHFSALAQSATETNLIEKEGDALTIRGNEIIVPTKPFEIRTVQVHLTPQEHSR